MLSTGEVSLSVSQRNLLVPPAMTDNPFSVVHTSTPMFQANGASAIADNQQLSTNAATVAVANTAQATGSAGTGAAQASRWVGLPVRVTSLGGVGAGALSAVGGSYTVPGVSQTSVGVYGAAQAVNADGSPATAVPPLALWQMRNGSLDTIARVGLPVVAAVMAYKGHTLLAAVTALPAAVLWYNRLKGGL